MTRPPPRSVCADATMAMTLLLLGVAGVVPVALVVELGVAGARLQVVATPAGVLSQLSVSRPLG